MKVDDKASGGYPEAYFFLGVLMGVEKCFHNLVKDDNFVKEFKDYVKKMYKTGQISEGFPKSWNNANRQINRVIAFARGTGSQARSGKKALSEGGWLYNAINSFFEETLEAVARQCLRNEVGMIEGGDKPVGWFGGLMDEYEGSRSDYRGTFEDWDSLKNYGGMFIASVPTGLAIVCGKHVYVLPST